jgi:hypothetical protein
VKFIIEDLIIYSKKRARCEHRLEGKSKNLYLTWQRWCAVACSTGKVRDYLIRLCSTFLFYSNALRCLRCRLFIFASFAGFVTIWYDSADSRFSSLCMRFVWNRRERKWEREGEGERRVSICASKASKLSRENTERRQRPTQQENSKGAGETERAGETDRAGES